MIISENRFDQGKQFLQSLGFGTISHSKRTLLDHLVSTAALLIDWGCAEDTYLAGLFHAVYGTESFRSRNVPAISREAVQNVIGLPAEHLAWLFGVTSGASQWAQYRALSACTDRESEFVLINRMNGQSLVSTRPEILALVNITVANALDQAQHLPSRYDEVKLMSFYFLIPHAPPRAAEVFNRILSARKAS